MLEEKLKKNRDAMVKSYLPKEEKTLTLTSAELPEIKDWEPGKPYRIVLDVIEESQEDGEDGATAVFKIKKASVAPEKGEETVEAEPQEEPEPEEQDDENILDENPSSEDIFAAREKGMMKNKKYD